MHGEYRPTPSCFPSRAVFRLWVEAARGTNPGRSEYCTDCTPEYQAAMLKQHRCEHPGVTFSIDEHGLIEGRRPAKTDR